MRTEQTNDPSACAPRAAIPECTPRPMPQNTGCPPGRASANGLDSIVADYVENGRGRARDEMDFFATLPTLAIAVRTAALAKDRRGKRFGHQRRFKSAVLEACADSLAAALPRLEAASTFEDLHDVVEKEIGGIYGVGRLMLYDTALRIGAHRGLEPARVFLHAGTRVGARRLGLDSRAKSLAVSDLPAALHALAPREIEDVLCIYKRSFSGR
jgi:hypothetical protein